jgi:hypothetical protein
MTKQLRLIDLDPDRFRLDEPTRETGRRGIAKAREALRESAARVEYADPSITDLAARPARPAPPARTQERTDRSADAA